MQEEACLGGVAVAYHDLSEEVQEEVGHQEAVGAVHLQKAVGQEEELGQQHPPAAKGHPHPSSTHSQTPEGRRRAPVR